jgi:hypothetical protein
MNDKQQPRNEFGKLFHPIPHLVAFAIWAPIAIIVIAGGANTSATLLSDVHQTTGSVKQFIADHPEASDVSGTGYTVSGENSVIAFGTPQDYIVCGYNSAGSPDWFKYASLTDTITSGNGSEAGLCGEPDQRSNVSHAPRVLTPEELAADTSVSVSGTGGVLTPDGGVDLGAGSSTPTNAGSPSAALSAFGGQPASPTTSDASQSQAAVEVTK